MMRKISCLLVTAIAMIIAQTAFAVTHYVSLQGTNNSPYLNWADAATQIQWAVDASTAGDTVLVSNGVYQTGGTTNYPVGSLLTNRVAITSVITVRSANNDPTNTIIKGAWDPAGITNGLGPAAVRCVYMRSGSKLIGFTLTNGASLWDPPFDQDRRGGGVCAASVSPTVSNCVITGNSAYGGGHPDGGGGARYCTLYNCEVTGNYSYRSGGGTDFSTCHNCTIALNRCRSHGGGSLNGNLYNCMVISNITESFGGGVYRCATVENCTLAYNHSPGEYGGGATYVVSLRNCLIYGNDDGGVLVYNNTSAKAIESCTIVGNSGYGVYQNKWGTVPCTNIILNCIIYSNQNANNWREEDIAKLVFTNTCTYPTNAVWDASNTTNNPLLVDFGAGYGMNLVGGNYRLQANSPCVNRGLNQAWMAGVLDLDSHSRLDRFSGMVDMGCYEYLPNGMMFKVR